MPFDSMFSTIEQIIVNEERHPSGQTRTARGFDLFQIVDDATAKELTELHERSR